MSHEDIKVLIDMEVLTHQLFSKYIPYTFDEEGEVTNEEWKLWTKYWNVVQKLIEKEEK